MLRLLIRAKDGAASLPGQVLMSDTDLFKESRSHCPSLVCDFQVNLWACG